MGAAEGFVELGFAVVGAAEGYVELGFAVGAASVGSRVGATPGRAVVGRAEGGGLKDVGEDVGALG